MKRANRVSPEESQGSETFNAGKAYWEMHTLRRSGDASTLPSSEIPQESCGDHDRRSAALMMKHDELSSPNPMGVGMCDLSRREIIEELVRQGLCNLSRIKSECRRFERYWATRTFGSA